MVKDFTSVLDKFLKLQPNGTVGNLFIGGDGLAKGYYKQKDLTERRFVKNPYGNGLIYETGDVVKWNDDGELVFLGRNDNQIKIRGYRIELGDVEAKMDEIKFIEKAIVIAKKDLSGNNILVAYFTGKEDQDVNDFRFQLKKALPYYMIPSHYIRKDIFPLTANGKINRKALTNLKMSVFTQLLAIPLQSPKHKKICGFVEGIIRYGKDGINDNFFDLGGHSSSVTKLINKFHKEFSIKISINKIFEYPVLEEQSRLIESSQIISQNNKERDEETEFENFLYNL